MALLAVPWEATGSRLILALSAVALATIAWTALRGYGARVRVLAASPPWRSSRWNRSRSGTFRPPSCERRRPRGFLATGVDPALASGAHGVALRARPRRVEASWRTFAQKTPEWAGLAALFAASRAAGVAAASRRPGAQCATSVNEVAIARSPALHGRPRVHDVVPTGMSLSTRDVQDGVAPDDLDLIVLADAVDVLSVVRLVRADKRAPGRDAAEHDDAVALARRRPLTRTTRFFGKSGSYFGLDTAAYAGATCLFPAVDLDAHGGELRRGSCERARCGVGGGTERKRDDGHRGERADHAGGLMPGAYATAGAPSRACAGLHATRGGISRRSTRSAWRARAR